MEFSYKIRNGVSLVFSCLTVLLLLSSRMSCGSQMHIVFPFEAVSTCSHRADVDLLQKVEGELLNHSPSSNDVAMVASADIYFSLGTEWEGLLEKQVKAINANVSFHVVTNGCSIRPGNPYFWLSPENMAAIRTNVMRTISPGRSGMDCLLLKGICGSRKRSIIVFHRAFEYLADYYDLQAIYIDIENDTDDFVRQKLEKAREGGVNRAFCMRFQSREKVRQRCGLDAVMIDPYSKSFLVDFVRAVVEGSATANEGQESQ